MNKMLHFIFLSSLALPCYAIESASQQSSGSGLVIILFLGFIALIIVGQLIPGVMLFFSMIKGLFGKNPDKIKHAEHK